MVMFALMLAGCSQGTSPTDPGVETVSDTAMAADETNHLLAGIFTIVCDPPSGTVDIIPLRDADFHLNALKFMEPPPLVYLSLESTPTFDGNILDVDIGLRHPLPGCPELTIFDVCGIVFTNGTLSGFEKAPNIVMPTDGDTRLLNADGYTRWWNPVEFPFGDTIFNYRDGLLGTPYWIAEYNCTLNGFKYFADGLGKDDPVLSLAPSNRGVFSPGEKNIRNYRIDLSGGFVFNYAVDACWAKPDGGPPYSVPDDFPKEANRSEAYQVSVTETLNTLWYDPSNGHSGGRMRITVDVWDHYDAEYNDGWMEDPVAGTDVHGLSHHGPDGEGYARFAQTWGVHNELNFFGEGELLIAVESKTKGYGGVLPGIRVASYFVHKYQILEYHGICDPDVQEPYSTTIHNPGIQPYGTTEVGVLVEGLDDCTEVEDLVYEWRTVHNGMYPWSEWHFDPGPVINVTGLSSGLWYLDVRAIDEAGLKQWNPDGCAFEVEYLPGTSGWALRWGSPSHDCGYDVVVDNLGGVYTTGALTSSLYFKKNGESDKYISHGGHDIFLVKHDIDKKYQWCAGWGGMHDDMAYGLACDDAGNLYVTGFYELLVDFDPASGVDWRTSEGMMDIFVSKFNSDGEYLWGNTWGGESDDTGQAVAVDSIGDLYIAGTFRDTVDMDPGPGSVFHVSNGEDDVFLGKFDASGSLVWVRSWGGWGPDHGYAITFDGNGDVYVTGTFSETVDFDPGTGLDEHVSSGITDCYISKFNSSGDFLWARTWGDWSSDVARSVAVDASDRIIVTGSFPGSVDFDPGPGEYICVSKGDKDIYASIFDTDGGFLGAVTWGSSKKDSGRDVVVDAEGNVFFTGRYGGKQDLDMDPGPGFDLPDIWAPNSVAFLSKFNAAGEYQWGRIWGKSNFDVFGYSHSVCIAVAVDNAGASYVTGEFTDEGSFDLDPGPGYYTLYADIRDVFLIKYLPDGYWY